MWQEIIVGICVVAAVLFLLKRWWPFGRSKSSCNSCGSCARESSPADKTKA
jgi:hypothetical protein